MLLLCFDFNIDFYEFAIYELNIRWLEKDGVNNIVSREHSPPNASREERSLKRICIRNEIEFANDTSSNNRRNDDHIQILHDLLIKIKKLNEYKILNEHYDNGSFGLFCHYMNGREYKIFSKIIKKSDIDALYRDYTTNRNTKQKY